MKRTRIAQTRSRTIRVVLQKQNEEKPREAPASRGPLTRRMADFVRSILRAAFGSMLAVIFALAASGQSPQTYTYDASMSLIPLFNPNTPSPNCTSGNTSPQVGPQSLTFMVNMTCNNGTSSVKGPVTVSFSPTSVTGTINTAAGSSAPLVLTTPLNVTASANLTFTGAISIATFLGAFGATGTGVNGTSFCSEDFPGTVPEKASVNCNLTLLDINVGTGAASADVLLDIFFNDFETPDQAYLVNIVFDAPAAPKATLTVDHITVEQTIPDDQSYSTPIIAAKSAIVRVFPAVQGNNPAPLTGITGTLSGSGPGGNFGPLQPLPPQSGTVTARAAPIPANQDDALNFALPAQYLAVGTLQLTATVNPPASQTGINTSNNTLTTNIPVVAAPGSGELVVGYLPLSYQPPGLNKTDPTGNIANAYKLLNRLLPIGDGKVDYFPISAPGPVWTSTLTRASIPKFTATMVKIYQMINAGAPGVLDQMFVWLPPVYPYNCGDPNAPPKPPSGTRFPIGSSDPVWWKGLGHVAFGQDTTPVLLPNRLPGGPGGCLSSIDKYYLNMTLAHEVSHNLGLRHATSPTDFSVGCGAGIYRSVANWPYADSTIQQPGYDSISRSFKPNTKNDFMSYCAPPGNNVWISPFDYYQLYSGGFSPHLARPEATDAASSSQVLIISGTVSMDGATGSLDPGYLMPAGATLDPSDPNGNYCLTLSGNSGTLGSYCFTVNFDDDDPNDPDEVGPPFDERSFSVAIPYPAGTTQVALSISGTQLASLTATGKTPSVTITSPTAGATWQGSNTISWSATDPLGRSLMYTILYSSDGGKTYLPVSIDQPNAQYSLDTTQIMGGSQVYFQVVASAGLDTTTTTVGPVTVVQTPQIGVPASLDFGGQGPGLAVDQDLTIMSSGTGPLTVSSISINNPAFEVIDPLPSFPIPAGSQIIVSVRFTPAGTGSASGTLTISSNDPAHPKATVPLIAESFSSPVPNIQADASIQFPATPVGLSETVAFNITNTGGANLTINSIASSNKVFTAMGTTIPFTLAPNAQQAVMVQFAPTSVGAAMGTITVASNDLVHSTVSVAMMGTAVTAPSSPGAPGYTIEFGSVPVGSPATATIYIQPSTTSLTISNFTSSDPEFVYTGQSLPVNLMVGPNQSQPFTFTFTPTSTGDHTATLTVTANGSTTLIGPFGMDGTGTAPTGGGGTAPQITPGGVVNAADYLAKVSRGALAFAFGTNLASSTVVAQSLPLGFSLGGVSVTVGGVPAPIFIISSTFVEFQVPYEVALGSAVPVVVTVNGVPSNSVTLAVADYALGVFTYPRTATIFDPDVFHLNGTLLTPASPAVPNETVIVIANGIGKLNNPPTTGAAVGPPYPTAVDAPTVTINGVASSSQYAGLLAGDLAIVQMNIQLPANLPSGTLPLVIQFPGDSSPPVNVYVAGNVTATPKISATPSALNFGSVTVGATSTLSISISNSGTAPLTITSIASSNGEFTVTSPTSYPFTITAGGSQQLAVKFAPTVTGAQSGNLTIASNDPSSPQFTVGVSGTGTSPVVPSITVSPATLAFGSVTVGTTQSQTLTINNIGTATLSVSSIAASNSLFTPSTNSVSVAAGASINLAVKFAPTASGAQAATLTLTTNDPAHPSVTVALTGTGIAATLTTTTLSVDGGAFTNAVGFPGSPLAVFVNRLTPPFYPATLTAVEVYFGNRSTGLPVNSSIELAAGVNPAGSSSFTSQSLSVLNLYDAGITALGVFNVYTLPSPITITSGDFVVGFATADPTGIYPADEDQSTKSQGRSYVSTDGMNFTIIDSYGPTFAGNFGIRAVVTLGGPQ